MYKETPLIKQYYNLKKKYPDTILFFQVGDFYEIFGYDAIYCSRILEITLTKRNKKNNDSIYLVGFPCKALKTYLNKLIKKKIKVAICNQKKNEKDIDKNNIIDRKITNIVTSGISIYDDITKTKTIKKFVSSLYIEKNNKQIGISLIDFSTGELLTTEGDLKYIKHIINCYKPIEYLIQKSKNKIFNYYFNNIKNINLLDDNIFNYKYLYNKLLEHFKVFSLNCFGLENMKLSIISSGVLIFYIKTNYNLNLNHVNVIKKIQINKYVWIDDSTLKNLEIIKSTNKTGKSLFDILDKTYTSMGYRILNNWLIFPLKDKKKIYKRQNIIDFYFKIKENIKLNIIYNLKLIYDIEKLLSKISNYKINPNQLYKLINSIKRIKKIFKLLKIKNNYKIFNFKYKYIKKLNKIFYKINKIFTKDPINKLNKFFFIKKNISKTLDLYKKRLKKNKNYIFNYYNKLKKKLNINYLIIKKNELLGYFIEIKKNDYKKIPNNWIKKQKLSIYIRYTTKLINKFEYNIYNIKKKIFTYEKIIFNKTINYLNKNIIVLKKNSYFIAKLDVLFAFYLTAKENNYTKPKIINNELNSINIIEGRHPVIEKTIDIKNNYIPNNIYLDNLNNQILIITGPNMSGKSAILRQTALIVIMVQIGSFVPAKIVEINIIDKLFSRIGASDNISMGESTFMVEMNETANILNNISKNSLIIMDEIGRGTSTYEGIALSYSIIKYLINNKLKPRVLFATHYHELNKLLNYKNNIKYFFFTIKKNKNNFIFIRKLQEGLSNNSYGYFIAKMAGIPIQVIKDTKKITLFLKNN
ncbi:DNA mismatch repair protein MutS [Candidatus Shikimatogenerans bostrichidophilus]|uniref:DNA mismatch repair protein MutS n=1 Tax=Candidatus Shikimatogenerans bostrichidophilus TaxID=2943807 RepID=UPI0029677078